MILILKASTDIRVMCSCICLYMNLGTFLITIVIEDGVKEQTTEKSKPLDLFGSEKASRKSTIANNTLIEKQQQQQKARSCIETYFKTRYTI